MPVGLAARPTRRNMGRYDYPLRDGRVCPAVPAGNMVDDGLTMVQENGYFMLLW